MFSSTLQRSKTAPTPLVDSPTVQRDGYPNAKVGAGRRAGYDGLSGSGARGARVRGLELVLDLDGTISTSASARRQTHPPLVSPRHDIRDNPFNLAGFFPSRPGSPDHPVEWATRTNSAIEDSMVTAYTEVESEEKKESDTDTDTDIEWRKVASVRSLSLNALDDYAREVIARESQFGILGIARVPSFLKSIKNNYFGILEEEDQQVSGASDNGVNMLPSFEEYDNGIAIDEPFDAETLCESIHSRRLAAESKTSWESVPSVGLFSPTRDEGEEGWLYCKLLGTDV